MPTIFFLISLFCSLCLPGIANVQNIHTDHRKGIKKRTKSVVMEVNYERRCKNEMLLPYLVHYTRTQIDPMVPTMNAVIDYNRYEHLCVWPLTCNAHFQFVCLIPSVCKNQLEKHKLPTNGEREKTYTNEHMISNAYIPDTMWSNKAK